MSTTELSFLIDLLLEHDLKPETRKLIAGRIKDVELSLSSFRHNSSSSSPIIQVPAMVGAVPQAASTLANLARSPDIAAQVLKVPEPVHPNMIAQTPAAVAAMASRERAIQDSINGKTNKETGRPRKF